MNLIFSLVYLATAIFNTILGTTVWLKNPKNRINQAFVAFIVGIVVWIVTLYYLYNVSTDSSYLLFFGRLNYFASVLLIFFLFLFTHFFPRPLLKANKLLVIFFIESIVLSLVSLFTPLIDQSEDVVNGSLITTYGPLFYWFAVHFIFFLGAAILMLFIKHFRFEKTEKRQIHFVLIGIIMTGIFAATTNLIIPLIFKYYDLQSLAPVSTIFMITTISYAIIKHRLLDITPLIARAVSYIFLLFVFIGTFIVALFASTQFIPNLHVTEVQIVVFSIITFVIIITLNPLRHLFEVTTDRIFYRGYYDGQELLQNLTQIMASTIEIDQLSNEVINVICNGMNITKGCLFVVDKAGSVDSAYKSRKGNYSFPSSVDLANLAKVDKPLVFDELEDDDHKSLMRKTRISIFIPLKTTDQLVGYLVLGEKASGDIYHSKDIHVLRILGPELAVALQNAQSYQEIQEFSHTLEKKVEERTQELRETQKRELAKANEVIKLKDEFVFIATHDLRSPVTAFNGYIDLIKNSPDQLSADTKENIDAISEAGNRLNQLVDDLLEVARSESGTLKIKVGPVDIVKVIEESLRQAKIPADQKQVHLVTKLDYENNIVLADEEKLSEVFENLLGNAVKFNRHNGLIEVFTVKKNDQLEVKVSDTGFGIPKGQQDKVFQKFFKYRGDETLEVPGTGLGLFVVRMLIEKMKGEISFVSEEGKGTTFTFHLPLAS